MNQDSELHQSREDWTNRQREHGNRPRAVLMKGLHPRINDTIDLWHRSVMRAAFEDQQPMESRPSLDIGCGYGRLADQAIACGLDPIFGIDFTQKFCADFQRDHGPAVCGELSRLPFLDASFNNCYSVTALMYLSCDEATRALREVDRCVTPGARVLVLEPSREFNSLVRFVLRWKARETLSRPGFSAAELCDAMPPRNWRRLRAGGCAWMTALLPALVATARRPSLYGLLSRLVLRMDRPGGKSWRPGRFAMYRWAVYEKQ